MRLLPGSTVMSYNPCKSLIAELHEQHTYRHNSWRVIAPQLGKAHSRTVVRYICASCLYQCTGKRCGVHMCHVLSVATSSDRHDLPWRLLAMQYCSEWIGQHFTKIVLLKKMS